MSKTSKKLIREIVAELDKKKSKKEKKIPLSVFATRKLTAFEALVLYLKDLGHSYHEIAVILKRDDRTIWNTYQRAIKKK